MDKSEGVASLAGKRFGGLLKLRLELYELRFTEWLGRLLLAYFEWRGSFLNWVRRPQRCCRGVVLGGEVYRFNSFVSVLDH